MTNETENAKAKAQEAEFFLYLMDEIERTGKTYGGTLDVKQEYTYFLSAFLNACYSAIEQLRQCDIHRKRADRFKQAEAAFYKYGYGWRALAVHWHPVTPGYYGYIAPPGDNVILRFRERECYKSPHSNRVDFHFGNGGYYYFTAEPEQNAIGDICSVHLSKLKSLSDA